MSKIKGVPNSTPFPHNLICQFEIEDSDLLYL